MNAGSANVAGQPFEQRLAKVSAAAGKLNGLIHSGHRMRHHQLAAKRSLEIGAIRIELCHDLVANGFSTDELALELVRRAHQSERSDENLLLTPAALARRA